MSCTMSWVRQEPSTPGYTGCYGCGEHDHRHAECMYGETQEREDELKSAGQEVAELVAKLIEERGVDAVREKLRAVFAQGGALACEPTPLCRPPMWAGEHVLG